ncbi:transposase [Streptomyces sp. NPDC101490]|uniref:IS701 family transposase n=1 Tax=Streptomyces sp. NPDC101490 TaxID=3366143 RepID=UPI00380B6E09
MTLLHNPTPTPTPHTTRLPPLTGFAGFTDTLFGCLPRADQRKWAHLYVEALLRTPGKKSPRRLAESVSASPTASQALHQFVNASPWDWTATRQALLRRVARTGAAVTSWTLAPAFIPKRGDHSAGVHRRFDPLLGRLSNGQLGLVVLATGEHGPLPVDWHLYIPRGWTRARRSKARVPEDISGPLWSQASELLGRAPLWHPGAHAPVTAELSWLPDREAFLSQLVRSEQPFVVEVPDTVRVLPGAIPSTNWPTLTVRQVLMGPTVTGEDRQHVLSLPVSLPGPASGHVRLRLLVRRRPCGSTRTWLTNMVDRRLPELLPLMRQPRLAANVVDTLNGDFGLQDFEGRSYPGWHHHTTLVSAAFAYSRLRGRPLPDGDEVRDPSFPHGDGLCD